MSDKRKTVVSIETRQLTVIRARRPVVLAWCERCSAQVRMVTPEQAAAFAGTRPRAIYRRVESGGLHFIETGEGLLICAGSL